MLKPVLNDTGHALYCGPTVICTITGKPASRVEAVINRTDKNWRVRRMLRPARSVSCTKTELARQVRKTNATDLREAFRQFGWDFRCVDFWCAKREVPTLAAWLRARPADAMRQIFVVNVTDHWVAVRGRKFCDTKTGGNPVFIRKAPGRRALVRAVYTVERL